MTVLRELITVLGYDLDEADAKKAEKVFDNLQKGALAVVAGVGAAAAALGVLIAKTVEAGDQAAKTGKALGLSAEEVQELTFAAKRSGSSFDKLRVGILKLQQRASEARKGNKEYAKTFREIGVGNRDLSAGLQDPLALLLQVADGLGDVETQGDKARIAMKLFEEGGAELIPFLDEGSEGINNLRRRAQALGFVMDNEAAAAAERINDSFLDMSLLVTGLGRRLAIQLFPVVERVTNATIDWFVANRALVDRGLARTVAIIEEVIDFMGDLAGFLVRNRRFFAIFTAVAVAGLVKLSAAFLLAAASAIKAAVVAAAPFLFVIGLAFLIALVIEDVFVFVSGGESAIGNFFEAFQREAQKPNAHWVVRTIFFIIKTIKEAIEAVSFFFESFFEEASELGGITEALKEVFSTAIDFWKEQIVSFAKFLFDTIVGALRKIPFAEIAQAISNPTGFLAGGASRLVSGALGFGDNPGGAPASPPPAAPGAGGVNVGDRVVQVTVQGGGADANAVASETADRVSRVLEADRRETLREVGPRVVR